MQKVRWILLNGIIGLLLWLGLAMDIQGAKNVGLFAVWLLSIISLASYSQDVAAKIARNKRYPTVPGWLDTSYDLFIVGLLVWFGCWWSGTAFAIHMVGNVVLRERVNEIRGKVIP